MDFLGYEFTQSPIFDLDHGGPIFGQEKKGWPRPKIGLQKFRVNDVEAFKKGYWGGNIEGTLKKVYLEKILSQTYLGRIFLKLHI